jgi:hypothetical protein
LEKDWNFDQAFPRDSNLHPVSFTYQFTPQENIMKKSSLFISVALTTFVLTVVVGVLSVYRSYAGTSSTNTQAQVTATATGNITAEQAAQVAAQFLGRNDLYSVETSSLNGTDAYKVTFSSGTILYVNMAGQVVYMTTATTAPAAAPVVIDTSASAPVSQPAAPPVAPSEGEHENGDHD